MSYKETTICSETDKGDFVGIRKKLILYYI